MSYSVGSREIFWLPLLVFFVCKLFPVYELIFLPLGLLTCRFIESQGLKETSWFLGSNTYSVPEFFWILLLSIFPCQAVILPCLNFAHAPVPEQTIPSLASAAKFPRMPAAELPFIQKDYASQTGIVTPECQGEQSLQQGRWFWVAVGEEMSPWTQYCLPFPTPFSCVSPSLHSPGFLWHHSIKGTTTCCQPVSTKIDEETSLWGKVFSERKVLPVLSRLPLPHPSHTSDHAVDLFHGIFYNVFAQIVRPCCILQLDFTGFSHLYNEAAETGLTQTSYL